MTVLAAERLPLVPVRAGRRAWVGLAVLLLPTLLVSLDNTVLGFALPAISAALTPSAPQLLWLVDIYPLVLAGLLVTMGTLGDRIGHRRMLMLGVTGFGSVSVVAAFVPDALYLVGARALLGFFGAMLMPASLALLRELFTDRAERRLAVAIWATGFAAGAALGPILGGALLQHFWWGAVFLANVPPILLLLGLAGLMLPESRAQAPGRLDLLGVLLSLLTMVPAVLAITLLTEQGLSAEALVFLAVGVGSGILFVRRARARLAAGEEPLLDVSLFASPVLRASALANATTMFALTGLLFFSAQFLLLVRGLSPIDAGLVLLPGFLMTITAGLSAARLGRVFPLRVLVPTGLGLAAIGFLLCILLGGPTSVGLLVVASVLIGGGIGLSETITNDAILSAAPPERAGSASAVSETAYEIGAVLGTAVLGGVLTAVYRAVVQVPFVATPADAHAAGETLGGAVATAARLPGADGAALLESARAAFVTAIDVTALVGASTLAAVALAVLLGLRDRARAGTTEPVESAGRPGVTDPELPGA